MNATTARFGKTQQNMAKEGGVLTIAAIHSPDTFATVNVPNFYGCTCRCSNQGIITAHVERPDARLVPYHLFTRKSNNEQSGLLSIFSTKQAIAKTQRSDLAGKAY